MWLSHVDCNGTEPFISLCDPQWGDVGSSCDHRRDASVVCNSKYYSTKWVGLISYFYRGTMANQVGWWLI